MKCIVVRPFGPRLYVQTSRSRNRSLPPQRGVRIASGSPQRRTLRPARTHPPAALAQAVVLAVCEAPDLPVAVAVAGPERDRKPRLFPPLPEVLLEDLPLISRGELEEGLLLLVEDDRGDELGEPPPFFVRQRLDPRGLARRPGDRGGFRRRLTLCESDHAR